MSFPRYEGYKDSGVEWLGEVPEHWDVAALKYRFQVTGGSTPKSDNEIYWDGEIVWVTPSDLSKLSDLEISNSQRKVTVEGLLSCGTTLVPAGSLVLSTRAPIGSLAIADTELCTNQGCKSLVPSDRINSRFYAYFLSVATVELNIRGKGTTFLELSSDELGAFKITLLSLPEQSVIATFLDRETAKIDALVAEQQRLIELLKEKRQAVISHAVTKGLNPDAPMKDSGVEWLGEVPEHWELKLFRRVRKKIEQGWSPNAANDPCESGNWGVLKLSAIKQGAFFPCENKRLLAETEPNQLYEIKVGDLLITRANTPKFVGDACVVTHPNDYRLMLSDLIYRIHLNPLHDVNYICQFLISSYGRYQIEADARGSSMTMAKISQEHINAWIFPIPPFEEQSEITNYLNLETAKFNILISEANRAITLLQERRIALISAAVTGKIKVTGIAK